MGVTGMNGNVTGKIDPVEVLSQHTHTHYYNTSVYPVSGFMDFQFYFSDPPDPEVPFVLSLWSTRLLGSTSEYGNFPGTSAAAPQVSALAARLFEERFLPPTESSRVAVWNRIVNTTREPRGQIAGIVDYKAALEGWQ